MNDTDLLRFADDCPWAVARLRRRYERPLRAYLLAKLGSRLLANSCFYLTFWLLPQVCGEIRGESVGEFLLLVADTAICDFHLLSARLAA